MTQPNGIFINIRLTEISPPLLPLIFNQDEADNLDNLAGLHQQFRENCIDCLKQAIQTGQTVQLSDHPTTQDVLGQLRRS